jgi:hypothetical protein
MVVQQVVVYDEVAPVVEEKKAKVQRAAAPKVEVEAPAPVKKEKAKVQRTGSSTHSKKIVFKQSSFRRASKTAGYSRVYWNVCTDNDNFIAQPHRLRKKSK